MTKRNILKKSPKGIESLIRLNKFIANAGICSRRDADELIKKGEITINGVVVTELGIKVSRNDKVSYRGKILIPEKLIYVLLNKPKDFITTMDDPQGRRTVMDLVKKAGDQRIYPVGRLDRNTTGLLLLTNDGELSERLAHPSNNVKKIYSVQVDKRVSKEDVAHIQEGVELEDGKARIDQLAILSSDYKQFGLELHIGRNRIVRRIFEHFGYEVVKLDRVLYAGLDKQNLPRGKWRYLTDKEVNRLKGLR
ncbi:MAG: pseudouridine synthase [Bacteroidota bacterium]